MRGALRRPLVRRARPPPRFCLFNILSSSSSLPFPSIFCFNFCDQFFASFLAVLGVFFSPPLSSPRLAHSAVQIGSDPFFCFFCVFLPSIFLLFFGLLFYPFLVVLSSPGDPKIKPILIKNCFERGFLDDFYSCANF